jgi:hypothetical protein
MEAGVNIVGAYTAAQLANKPFTHPLFAAGRAAYSLHALLRLKLAVPYAFFVVLSYRSASRTSFHFLDNVQESCYDGTRSVNK